MLCTSILYSQSKDDAALYAIWSDTTKPETDRLEAYFTRLNDFKMFYQRPEETKWLETSNEALELAQKLNRIEYLPLFYLSRGLNRANQNDIDGTLEDMYNVLESAKGADASLGAKFKAYLILFQEGGVKEEDLIREFDRIESSFSNSPNDVDLLRYICLDMGMAYFYHNHYPKALHYGQESQRLSQELGFNDDIYANATQGLAEIHLNIGNYAEAEAYLTTSLNTSHQLKDTMHIGANYSGMATLYLKLKDQAKAQLYIDSALYIMREVKHCEPCTQVAKVINAGIKNLSGNYSGALIELSEVGDFFQEQDGGIVGYPPYYIEKANAYLGLHRYDEAIKSLTFSKEILKAFFKTESEKYTILVKAYEGKRDYKKALENFKQYIVVEDTLAVLRNSSEVTRMELENQFARQQLKAELEFQAKLNKQKATKNILILLGVGAFLAVMGLLYRLKFIRKTQKVLEQKNEIIEAEKEKAKASERAKHQFLANMSHEIRTPMNAIMGMTDILIRRGPKDEQKEYLNSIKQSSDSLLVVINDILDIAKIESGKVELEHVPFSISDLLYNVHTIMQFKAEEKGLELRKDMPAEDLYVKGDATRLRQILINLIGNAIKFTEKGLVTTALKAEKVDDRLNLHFTVSDTGIGIDKDRMDKIFNSFEQAYADTSRKFGGTGLGLSISKMLVEMQHGKIWVESNKGKGSQFHFTIPYEIAETTTSELKPADTNGNSAELLKGIKVLLVEDNQFNAVVAQEELEDAIEGVIVEVAENGAIAVEKLRSGNYDVILMDVQMPKMNGYEATKAIRAFTDGKADTPIIAMTANVLKEEVDLCYQAGMNDFIGKPFDTNELLQKIYNLKIKTHD